MALAVTLFVNIIVWSQFYQMFNKGIDSAFNKHVSKFERYYEKKVEVGINFGDIEDSVGLCYLLTGNIEIDKEYWDRQDEAAREELIFHELGHCVMGKEHNEKMIGDCPASIMYPYIMPDCYTRHREYYIKELFDKFEPTVYNNK
jgi:hypothetical protein